MVGVRCLLAVVSCCLVRVVCCLVVVVCFCCLIFVDRRLPLLAIGGGWSSFVVRRARCVVALCVV